MRRRADRVQTPSPVRFASPLLGSLAVLVCALCGAAPAAWAQRVKPWVPPDADSLVLWATEAKARFQSNTGDTIGGTNYRAYDLVSRMGRRLLRSLGQGNLGQSHAIEPILDSLGLDTEIEVDPELPHFVLLMVRNPYRLTADAVGYLYWYRQADLRFQGVLFRGGMDPRMRVWWTGRPTAPYAWGIVDRQRGEEARMRLTFMRLMPHGGHWNLIQAEEDGPDLGNSGGVSWVDTNGDGQPELVVFARGVTDSLFEDCSACPRTITELVFTERTSGFQLHDNRVLPSPFTTFTLFVRLLIDGNRAAAARLVRDPARVQAAIADGWGLRRAPRTWKVESSEPDQPWPRWLLMRFRGAQGVRHYRVRFEMERGRWIIRDWEDATIMPPGTTPRSGSGGR
jgi:hypothetical protein